MRIRTLNLFLPAFKHSKTPFVLGQLTVETTELDHRAKIALVFVLRPRILRSGGWKTPSVPTSWAIISGEKICTNSFHVALLNYPILLLICSKTGEVNGRRLTVWPIIGGVEGLVCYNGQENCESGPEADSLYRHHLGHVPSQGATENIRT